MTATATDADLTATEPYSPVDDAHDEDAVAADGSGSVWAVAREAHADLARQHEQRQPLELEVPGAEHIVIRFRFVELAETEKSTKGLQKMRNVTDQALFAAIDTLILACDEILVTLPNGLTPLADPGDPPIRFDHRFCAGMGWEPLKARQIVRKLYGNVQGDYALLQAAQDVSEWMRSTGERVAEDFADG